MKNLFLIACGAVVLGIGFLVTACETEPAARQQVFITPESATVRYKQSVMFTATGGYEYKWSLENPDIGAISRINGDRTVYTCLSDPGEDNTERQVLTVTSYILGASGTGASATNSGDTTVSAEAYIQHVHE